VRQVGRGARIRKTLQRELLSRVTFGYFVVLVVGMAGRVKGCAAGYYLASCRGSPG
jgi:hypothetical protein